MLRTALQPRWLGLLALVIAVMVGFSFLGRWQWDVARDNGAADAAREAAARPSAPLTQVLTPGAAFPPDALDRKVTVAGEYLPDRQVLITGRKLGDRTGYWVVAPLRVEGAPVGDQGAPVIAVLRGFVTEAAAPPPPTGRVTLTGTVEQGEPSPDKYRVLPDGQLQTLSIPALLNRWGGQVYNGFVLLAAQEPALTGADPTPVPPPRAEAQWNWRNLGYAIQWFFFAAFALYMWWRMVREDHLSRRAVAGPAGAAPTAPRPDAGVGPDEPLPTPAPEQSRFEGGPAR